MVNKLKLLLLTGLLCLTTACSSTTVQKDAKDPTKETTTTTQQASNQTQKTNESYDFSNVPNYTETNEYVVTLNGNAPQFSDEEKQLTQSEIRLSELDSLGRCGQAFEVIGKDILPSEERKDIASIYPTGWHQENYGGTYVYNRSHLLAFCLSGLNDEKRNLITGTEHMNQDVMVDYEIQIKNYVSRSGNHVVYRVTPDFRNNELVARGVQMEAYSVEDNGQGICMNIYLYNTQPGVAIDYETGYTSSSEYVQEQQNTSANSYKINKDTQQTFVVNARNGKFHLTTCHNAARISTNNRQEMVGTVSEMKTNGYEPSKCCIKLKE